MNLEKFASIAKSSIDDMLKSGDSEERRLYVWLWEFEKLVVQKQGNGESTKDAAVRLRERATIAFAALADIRELTSAAPCETTYGAVSRLMDDYRHVVRQRDRLVTERGSVLHASRKLAAEASRVIDAVKRSLVGRTVAFLAGRGGEG